MLYEGPHHASCKPLSSPSGVCIHVEEHSRLPVGEAWAGWLIHQEQPGAAHDDALVTSGDKRRQVAAEMSGEVLWQLLAQLHYLGIVKSSEVIGKIRKAKTDELFQVIQHCLLKAHDHNSPPLCSMHKKEKPPYVLEAYHSTRLETGTQGSSQGLWTVKDVVAVDLEQYLVEVKRAHEDGLRLTTRNDHNAPTAGGYHGA